MTFIFNFQELQAQKQKAEEQLSSSSQAQDEIAKIKDDLNAKLSLLHQTQDELEVTRRENHVSTAT